VPTAEANFSLLAVDQFCSDLRKVIESSGGPPGFFAKMNDDAAAALAPFDVTHYRTLSSLLEDAEFRERFFRQISEDHDRNFLERFLESWKLWSELSPSASEFANAALILVFDQFSQPIPLTANDPQYCTSTMFVDTLTETIRVKTLLRMVAPNKELGGKQCFVIASTLERFLGTIVIMLGSIRLRASEVDLFKVSNEQKIASSLEALKQIKNLTDDLQKQFEGMRS
jgi:hypothetical protein